MMKNYLILVCLCFFSLFLIAKEDWNHLQFKLLDTESGLYNNQGRRIIECPDGQMLIGMEGMISVYNGCISRNNPANSQDGSFLNYSFDRKKSYHWSSSKEDEYIDKQGRLWIKDYYNLLLFDLNSYTYIYSVDSILACSGVTDKLKNFFLDENKDAWLFTERGQLYHYDWENPAQLIYDGLTDKDCFLGNVCSVLRVGDLCFFFLREGYMYCYDMNTYSYVYKDDMFASEKGKRLNDVIYYTLKQLDKERFCLMVRGNQGKDGVYVYNIKQRRWQELFLMENLNDIAIDKYKNIWVGSNGAGLYIWRMEDESLLSFKNLSVIGYGKFKNPYIYKFYVDSLDGIWLVTSGNGILYYNEKAIVGYNILSDEMPESMKDIRVMCRLRNGKIALGGVSGVSFYSQADNKIVPIDKIESIFCMHLAEDDRGKLWISSISSGLFCFDIETEVLIKYSPENVKGMPDKAIRFCYPLGNGKFLLCNGLNNLGYFYPETSEFVSFTERFPQLQKFRTLVQVVPLEDNRLLAAAQNGMFVYDAKTDEVTVFETGALMPAHLEKQINSKFNHVCRDSRGLWWIANPDGLNLYNPETQTLKKFSMADGLPNSCVQTVIEDVNRDIWVATSCGLARISLIKDESSSEGYSYHMINLTSYDGALRGEYLERSAVSLPNDKLCFGGIGGMTIVSPLDIEWGATSRKPIFVRLSLFNQLIEENGLYNGRKILQTTISQTQTIELNYNENFFSVGFSALNYENQSQTYFRYKLDGMDNNWTVQHCPDGYCRVSYTGVRPGKYTLRVYFSNSGFHWSEPAVLTIVVNPPLWATWWAYFIYALILLLLVRYVLKLYIVRKREKIRLEQEAITQREQQKLDEMKFRFFTNVSHEFRTPLTLIITPLEVLLKQVNDTQLHRQLEIIYHSAKDLLQMVNQLLDFRRLEKKGEHLNMMLVDIVPFIEMTYQSFTEIAKQKNIHYMLENRLSSKQEFFYIDQDKVHKILNNLLSNAFRFTPDGGYITFIAEFTTEKELRVSIIDTGMGMNEEDAQRVFDRFYQVRASAQASSSSFTGSGIGLHLVKEYVEMLQGSILVESEIGKGSTFCVTLPEIQAPEDAVADFSRHKKDGEFMDKNKPISQDAKVKAASVTTVLVVEDNARFREFLSSTLSAMYNVITAPDGEEGLSMARNMTPDLIVSDVMMPNMDGLELCRLLKSDIKTSHIPIILLTAKNTPESRTEGYEVGADSYIAKPFNMDMLLIRIAKLLEQREKRRDIFTRGANISPRQLTINSIDEDLIARAMECMEKNIGNADYSVEALSRDVGMDRTHLYRKMQAIIGQTPSEFMRTVRLKRAANLLESGKYSVADVSLMVGFNTQKYFTNYFKEMFGVMPGAYRSQKTEKK